MKIRPTNIALMFVVALLASCSEDPAAPEDTSGPTDTTSPTITGTDPVPGAAGISSGTFITVSFSEPVDKNTLNSGTFRVIGPSGLVTGVYGVLDNDAIFDAGRPFQSEATYFIRITNGIKDLAGNSLAEEKEWHFTVRDELGPTLVAVSPANDATRVPLSSTVTVAFNELIDSATVNENTFYVSDVAGKISGTYSADELDLIFTPDEPLREFETRYRITVTTGLKDVAGNSLQSTQSTDFSTAIVAPNVSYRIRQLRSGKYLAINPVIVTEFPVLEDYAADAHTQRWVFREATDGRLTMLNGGVASAFKLTGSDVDGGFCRMLNTSNPIMQQWFVSRAQLGLNGYELWLPLAGGVDLLFNGPSMQARETDIGPAKAHTWTFERWHQ